ncbi:hypothetical protein HPP92_007232 [Vanilla planifolia]|uniref:Uncharacterized protein n=1 Tax=Vanilla planifolia TaxID=51239 RepID=A0A835VA42_VANPL|nr:hypothetical protein HPP92_007462 [Vanilla planifolia]KAG0490369.1 hypothetical protein HPP92_007232 [Vanilla planifolia]
MGVLQLFIVASMPVLKVLLVTAVGAFIGTDYIGILGEEAKKHLNIIVFYVFSPTMVTTNLYQSITLDSVLMLWFMPVNILLTFIIGSAFGWVVIQITKAPFQLRGLIFGCCAAGNLGSFLLIIIPATCKENGSPFGDPDVCHKYGLAYASLSLAIAAIYFWSYVYNIMRISSRQVKEGSNADDKVPKLEYREGHPKLEYREQCTNPVQREITNVSDIDNDSSFVVVKDAYEREPFLAETSTKRKLSIFRTIKPSINFKKIFAPSTIAAIVGFTVGVISPIRKALIEENAPLRVVHDSASLISEGAIPSLTLIMGGNLIKGLRDSSIKASVIIGVIAVRYLLLPLTGIAIVKGAIHAGLVHADPLYNFVLLVQYAVPPAMNIGTITQLFGGQSECSVVFLWAYALASVSLTLWSMLFMWLVS